MSIRICSYNIEWFDELFGSDNLFATSGNPKKQKKITERLEAIADVIQTVDADLIGIIEAPNTANSGVKDTVACLEHFAGHFGLRTNKAMIGFASAGKQELAILFDSGKFLASHDPGGTSSRKNPKFTAEFVDDTDADRIKELYKHYRPPLEVALTRKDGGNAFHLMLVHTKSKGIFSNNDRVHREREAARNRRKLFAECHSIRQRIDEWQDQGRDMIVMGDVNDGPGMDFTESRFGRSAVEIVIGDVFEPDRILVPHSGRPKWGRYGWIPASASFTDSFTGDRVNVLIDHILISRGLAIREGSYQVWDPYENKIAKPHKSVLLRASDHFPVAVDIV